MMTTPDFVRHWMRGAYRDLQAAETLLHAGSYPQCIFLAHLAVEKLAKAIWIQEHQAPDPPKWHDLIRILSATSVVLPSDETDTASDLSALQVESRYPDYSATYYDHLTASEAQTLWNRTTHLRQYLLVRLP